MKKAQESMAEDEELESRSQCFLVPSLCALGDKTKVYLKMKNCGPRMRLTKQQREVYRMLEANKLFNKLASFNKKNFSSVKKAKDCTKAWKLNFCRLFGPDTAQLRIFLKQQMIEIFNGRKTRPALKLAGDDNGEDKVFSGDNKIGGGNSGSEVYQLLIAGQYHLKVIATPLNRKKSSFRSSDLQLPSDFEALNGAKGKSLSFKVWLEDRERKIVDYEHLLKSAKNELRVSAEELFRTTEDLDLTKRKKEALEKEISECKRTIKGLRSELEFCRKINENAVQKFESLELLLKRSRPTSSEYQTQELKGELRSKTSFLRKMWVRMSYFAAILTQYCRRFIPPRKTC